MATRRSVRSASRPTRCGPSTPAALPLLPRDRAAHRAGPGPGTFKLLTLTLALSGLQWGSPQFRQLTLLLKRRYEVGFLEPTLFRSASLEGGADGFLSRRSGKFRGNLRKALTVEG
jgi:hypothetical protein